MAALACAAQELVAVKLPRLHAHLQKLGCDMSIIATDWFLCLFSTSLPSEVRMHAQLGPLTILARERTPLLLSHCY